MQKNAVQDSRKSIKKVGLGLLSLVELVVILCVYGIGGMTGAYAWTIAIFILAPIACIAVVILIGVILVRFCRRKRVQWHIAYLIPLIVLAYPITILFGISNLTYPRHEYKEYSITMQMPVKNAELKGGKEYKTHAVWPSECYAYDILVEPYDIASDNLYDYGIYLADVVAPVSGTVIALEDKEEDIKPNTEEFTSALGNYIYIKIEQTNTYLILAHLEKDSITVKVGDKVKAGEYIAKVGNSGTTSEPHLHIQHQKNNPCKMLYPTCSEGLPIEFDGP